MLENFPTILAKVTQRDSQVIFLDSNRTCLLVIGLQYILADPELNTNTSINGSPLCSV